MDIVWLALEVHHDARGPRVPCRVGSMYHVCYVRAAVVRNVDI